MLATFAFLMRNLKGYRLLVAVAILMTFLQVGADILLGFPLKYITDLFQKRNPPDGLDPLIGFFDRFDQGSHATSIILFSIAAFLLLSMVSALLAYVQLYLAAYIAQHLTRRLRQNLFEHLQRLSLDWHGRQKKGDLIQRITGDIANIEKFVTDGLVDLLAGVLTITGIFVVMLLVSPSFTLISLAIFPVLALAVFGYTGSIKMATKKASKAAGQVANVAAEDIGAITVLKAFTLEERESLRFQGYVGKNSQAGLRAGSLQAQFTPVVAVLVGIGTALIMGVGAEVALGTPVRLGPLVLAAGSITAGTLLLFLNYLKMLYQPMRNLSKLTNLFTTASAGAERIQEVFDQAPEVLDRGLPYTGPQKLRGEIRFQQVVFGYTLEQPILRGINLHIPAGRRVALVGLSGGGKTTLVKLIPRFYEVQQGSVQIDGVDNRWYPLAVLRQNISLVLQESVLFEGTIRENIAVGKPGAADWEIMRAANLAHIHETILRLPEGYNTPVREQGSNFSGGQRQRLAIARAILRDAPILILDEPTASLDVEAEAEVMRALDSLIKNRTVLMISHRLSTLGNVDEIIVLKDGQIVEQGTFKELKLRGGVFAALLAEQNRYNLERSDNDSIIRSAHGPAMILPAASPQVASQRVPIAAAAEQQAPQGVPPQWAAPAAHHFPVPTVQGQPQWPAPVVQNPPAAPVVQARVAAPVPAYAAVLRQPPTPQVGGAPPNTFPLRAVVFIQVNGKIVRQRALNKPALTLGRVAGNDVVIPSERVSRFHARIVWEEGQWVIEDGESLNGLTYQGRRIMRMPLHDGDRIFISRAVMLQYSVLQ